MEIQMQHLFTLDNFRPKSGILHLKERNRARDYYNPLRGLDMPRIVRLLEEGERGRYGDLQWLYRTMEKRDATVKGLKMRRLSAIGKLEWNIRVRDDLPAGMSRAQAEAQAARLRAEYEGIENLNKAIQHLALASFRGFSILEKHYTDGNAALPLTRLEPVPQWHWVRHPETWGWVYDCKAQSDWTGGDIINPNHFVLRELDDPINEIAAICFLRKSMAQKDWDAFLEDFGIPSVFAVLGESTPADKVKEWLEVMERVTGNSRGALPPGSSVETIAQGHQGETPFKQHKDEQREEVVLAGTGGLLAMLTAATGLNSEQAKVHEAAFDAIAAAEAADICEALQGQVDDPLLDREFPGQAHVAYFALEAQDAEDRGALAELLANLAAAGLQCDSNEISERMGLKLTRAPAPLALPAPAPRPGFMNRAPDAEEDNRWLKELLADTQEKAAAAELQDWRPLLDRLAALEKSEGEEYQRQLRALREELPDLVEKAYTSGGVVAVLADALEKAAKRGLETP